MQMAKCLECLRSLKHTFLPKIFFQRVWGVYKIVLEILEGWEVILVVKKMEIPGGGGHLCGIPSMVGVWIFSGATQRAYNGY